ncbi:MAG: hypothetical protein NZO58_11930, partial [Gemmataceae bacterium]|nr:hypothetical protein [Gemmataceae bacterium]
LIAVQSVAPSLDQPLLVLVGSGLASLLLFRWFLMVLSSAVGSVLLCYCGLALLHGQGVLDAAGWIEHRAGLVNGAWALMAIAGFLAQLIMGRRRHRQAVAEDEIDEAEPVSPATRYYRQAG